VTGVFHITLGMGPGPLDLGILAIFVLIGSLKFFLVLYYVFLKMHFISIKIRTFPLPS
jgi:hypothetical protein